MVNKKIDDGIFNSANGIHYFFEAWAKLKIQVL